MPLAPTDTCVRARPIRWGALFLFSAGIFAWAAILAGCQQNHDNDPTTRALADPMNYSPNFGNNSNDPSNMDSRSFGKELNDVLNP